MLAYLEGEVLNSDGQEIVLKVSSGEGYQVFFPKPLLEGQSIKLFIAHITKDTGPELYGFQTSAERRLFKMLTTVKGVGPKTGFLILHYLGIEGVHSVVETGNKKRLKEVPGVGDKLASQILFTLQNKDKFLDEVKALLNLKPGSLGPRPNRSQEESVLGHSLLQDVLLAAQELGMKEENVLHVANQLLRERTYASTEELLLQVLRFKS